MDNTTRGLNNEAEQRVKSCNLHSPVVVEMARPLPSALRLRPMGIDSTTPRWWCAARAEGRQSGDFDHAGIAVGIVVAGAHGAFAVTITLTAGDNVITAVARNRNPQPSPLTAPRGAWTQPPQILRAEFAGQLAQADQLLLTGRAEAPLAFGVGAALFLGRLLWAASS